MALRRERCSCSHASYAYSCHAIATRSAAWCCMHSSRRSFVRVRVRPFNPRGNPGSGSGNGRPPALRLRLRANDSDCMQATTHHESRVTAETCESAVHTRVDHPSVRIACAPRVAVLVWYCFACAPRGAERIRSLRHEHERVTAAERHTRTHDRRNQSVLCIGHAASVATRAAHAFGECVTRCVGVAGRCCEHQPRPRRVPPLDAVAQLHTLARRHSAQSTVEHQYERWRRR